MEGKAEKDKVLIDLLDRYSPEYKEIGMKFVSGLFGEKTAAFKMQIKKITGKGKYS